MIPIRNRKKTLQLTVDEMRNFAFAYVEKYAPSKQQLKTYLLKKYMKLSASGSRKQDMHKLIDIVLSDLEKNKFINDQFYSDGKAKSMVQRGNSINKIRSYLIGKGINNNFIKETVDKIKENNSDQDFFSAIKICKKKRIGPARTEDNRTLLPLEAAIDIAIRSKKNNICVLRGSKVTNPKYKNKNIFGAGINLTHLYEGKIPFLWYITRELGAVSKVLRGHSNINFSLENSLFPYKNKIYIRVTS